MMLDGVGLATYLIASFVVIVVPGPTVTVIVANSLRDGVHAGMLNVAGTQAGLFVMLIMVALGLEVIVTQLTWLFDWIRILGAVYLIWLGIRLLRASGSMMGERAAPTGSFFWQGVMVIWSNPKAFVFLGAFIPQFIDPRGEPVTQTLVLGVLFMAVGACFDSVYALLAAKARSWLTGDHVKWLERGSGTLLIAGGLWLAVTRA